MTARFRLFATIAIAGATICLTPAARADIFDLNALYCNCLPIGSSAGTVNVTQSATNIVDVLVSLNSPMVFHQTSGLDAFEFNIDNGSTIVNPTLTQTTSSPTNGELEVINGGGGTWTLSTTQPIGHEDGAGYFQYSLQCTAGPNECVGPTSTLEFQVNVTGLVVADFKTKNNASSGSNAYFAANVSSSIQSGCTGMVGAGGTSASGGAAAGTTCASTPLVPEPTSIAFFGTGLLAAGFALRRKFKANQ